MYSVYLWTKVWKGNKQEELKSHYWSKTDYTMKLTSADDCKLNVCGILILRPGYSTFYDISRL